MTEEIRKAFEILDLNPGASLEDIRAAYRDLVRIWHPDRHQSESERLRLRAEEKLKRIIWAYERLEAESQAAGDPVPILMDFGERWGFVDTRGNTLIHPQFDEARNFAEGLAAVRIGAKWGFIDTNGEVRVSPLYEACGDFSEGLAAVRWYGRWGYVDREGAFVVMPRFQEAGPFRQGFADVRLGARRARLNRHGELSFPSGASAPRLEG